MAIKILQGPVIRANEALSDPLDASAGRVVRIHMPFAWTGEVPITFQISLDGVNWNDLFDAEGQEVRVSVVPGTVALVQKHQVRQAWVRFRSGWRSNLRTQTDERVFRVVIDKA